MESGQLVRIGRRSKIFLQINQFLFVIHDYLIRNHRKVGIPVVQKRRFPVHQPYAVSVKKDGICLPREVTV
jgi:2-phosphoglycerate kinase